MADSFIELLQANDPSSKGKGRVFLETEITEADERRTHVLKVSTSGNVLRVTPTLSTSAYGTGEVLFGATEIPNAVRTAGAPAVLQSLQVIDQDEEGVAIDFYFFDATVTFGTLNDAVTISDADAAKLLGIVSVGTDDYKDLGGVKVACLRNLGLPVEAASGRSIYVAAVVTGTPTFTTASDLVIKPGFLW